MTDDLLQAPGSASNVDWKALYLHLLIIFPYSVESVNTQFGEKSAVRADIYDTHTGNAMLDALIFPMKLVGQTSGVQSGKAVVGRVTLGEAKGGQNQPWELEDPTPADFDQARAYLAARPPRPVPTNTLRSAPAPAAQPAPVAQPQWQPQPTAQPAQPQWQPGAPTYNTATTTTAPATWAPSGGNPAGAPPAPPAGPPAGLTGPASPDQPPF